MRNKDQILIESLYDQILILEKGSPVLFHYTSIGSVVNMVNTGNIQLTYASGSDRRQSAKGRSYYFSMTRVRHGGYGYQNDNSAVILELDGSRLGSRYRIRPFDYWNYSWGKQLKFRGADEQEDRLFSHDPEIPLFPYLKSINIFINYSHKESLMPDIKNASYIKKKCEENNIPCFIYDDLNAWRTNNRKKSIDMESGDEYDIGLKTKPDDYVWRDTKNLLTIIKFINDPFNRDDDVKEFLSRYRGFDWKNSVSSMLQNSRKNKDQATRNAMYEISKIERKNKKNILDVIDNVYDIIRSYEHIKQIKEFLTYAIYSITGEKHSGGIRKENLETYLDRYTDKFTEKLVGPEFVKMINNAIISLFDYSIALKNLQKAKEYLDNMDIEKRSYLVANQQNRYS